MSAASMSALLKQPYCYYYQNYYCYYYYYYPVKVSVNPERINPVFLQFASSKFFIIGSLVPGQKSVVVM